MPGEFTPEQLRQMLAEAEAGQTLTAPSTITVQTGVASLPTQPVVPIPGGDAAARYSPTSWGSSEFDFVTPSGQMCRLRKIPEIELLEAGILDKITRLPGLAQQLVDRASGIAPTPEMDLKVISENRETLEALLEIVDKLTVLAVIKPTIHAVPVADETGEIKGRNPDWIYIDSVDLMDRIAIMNRSLAGLKAMDSFRNQS
jgi:hypothetical protein